MLPKFPTTIAFAPSGNFKKITINEEYTLDWELKF